MGKKKSYSIRIKVVARGAGYKILYFPKEYTRNTQLRLRIGQQTFHVGPLLERGKEEWYAKQIKIALDRLLEQKAKRIRKATELRCIRSFRVGPN